MYPLISEYIEAIKSAEDNFKELNYLRPVLGEDGLPVMTSGNFAVVFKMKDERDGKLYALKCFTKEQKGREEAYHEIAKELKDVSSSYIVSIQYLEKELFVDTCQDSDTEFPVLLMDWVEGMTLDKYLRENLDDKYALEMLAYRFSQLAQWLIPRPFAHGDLKPDNILVCEDGSLVLVDYDGMYVPAMKGQKARELGSPDFRHPARTEDDFDEHIDDFSLISILLSLKAISLYPLLLEHHGISNHLLFSEKDYCNIHQCKLLKELFPSDVSELNVLVSLFVLALDKMTLYGISISLLNQQRPKDFDDENLSMEVTKEDLENSWTDEYGVMYSQDRKRLLGVYRWYLDDYEILEGTKVICDDSLNGFWDEIEGLMISGKIKIPSTVQHIGRNPFRGDYDKIECQSPYFVIEDEALYTSDKRTLISCFSKKNKFSIPDGVERIGSFAFYDCDISQVTIPATVSYIGDNPFIDMNFLSKASLEIICNSPHFFVKNNTLYKANPQELISFFGKASYLFIEEGTEAIGAFAFFNKFLKSIYLPSSIRKMPKEALWGTYMKQLMIPLKTLNKFNELLPNCLEKLLEVDISNMTIDKYGAIYDDINKRILNGCDISEYVISDGTTEIFKYAFSDCTSLKKIEIPNSVREIGHAAFANCKSLKDVFIPNSVTNIGKGTFRGCDNLCSIVIPTGTKKRFERLLPQYKEKLYEKDERIGTMVTDEDIANAWIDEYGVKYSADKSRLLKAPIGVEVYSIRAGTRVICDYAFSFCQLKSISIPSSISSIGIHAFSSSYLTSIIIPNSVRFINRFAFHNCSGLTSILIPNSVRFLGRGVFAGCSSLLFISLPFTIKVIEECILAGCEKLHYIQIPLGTKNFFDKLLPEYKSKFVEI